MCLGDFTRGDIFYPNLGQRVCRDVQLFPLGRMNIESYVSGRDNLWINLKVRGPYRSLALWRPRLEINVELRLVAH